MRSQNNKLFTTVLPTILFLVLACTLAGQAHAQDVVYLKDGSIVRGKIIEQIPAKSLKIQTQDGNIFAYQMDEIEKITTAEASAGSPGQLRNFKGFKFGLVNPGTSWAGANADDGAISWSIGGFYDYALSEKLHGGLELDLEEFAFSYYDSEMHTNLALSLKALIQKPGSKTIWRPGLYLGYGYLTGFEAQFFNVGAMVEVVFSSQKSFDWLAELAIIGAPAGGNEDFDMSSGPGFRLRAGMSFK